MIAAQMAQQIVRAAHEVTEEREVITEVTTEQIEVIKKPEVTETVTTEIRKEVRFRVGSTIFARIFRKFTILETDLCLAVNRVHTGECNASHHVQ